MKKSFVLLLSLFLLVTASCSQENVYRDDLTRNIWRVEDRYFTTMQDAADYIIQHQWTSKDAKDITDDIPESNTAHLLKNVLDQKTITDKETDKDGNYYSSADVYSEEYRKGLAITDTSVTGTMKIDFGGYRYDFYYESTDKDSWFFRIDSGEKIDIMNGQSVIFNEADHNPYAISVDTKVVTIDAHLLDDRRYDPDALEKSNNNLIYIGPAGVLNVTNTSLEQSKASTGIITLVTNGESGGKLNISNAAIVMTEIQTKYQDPDTKDVKDSIPDDVEFTSDDQKSQINLYSGWIDIHGMSQKEDFYDETTGKVNEKAVLSTYGKKEESTTGGEGAEIWATHDLIDVVNQDIQQSEAEGKGNAVTEIIHGPMEFHKAVAPTCITSGNVAYYQCMAEGCGKYFEDKEGMKQIKDPFLPIDSSAHSLEHVEYKAPTCTENGNIEYWHCTLCGKYFSDEAATTEITVEQTVLDALGHEWSDEWTSDETSHWHACIRCGAKKDEAVHESTSGYIYDLDNHWHVCEVCEAVYGKETHDWSDYKEVSSGHLVATCSICGAKKVADHEEYLVYDIGIGEARLKNIEATPCGDFLINGIKIENNESLDVTESTVTAEFRPYLNSNTDYTPYCYVNHNGTTSSITSGAKDSEGCYKVSFTLTDKKEYGVNIQAMNQGGTLGITCYLHLKNM